MRFQISYAGGPVARTIEGKLKRTGEVLQELRWIKQADGWKIMRERDLRVIQPSRQPLNAMPGLIVCQ